MFKTHKNRETLKLGGTLNWIKYNTTLIPTFTPTPTNTPTPTPNSTPTPIPTNTPTPTPTSTSTSTFTLTPTLTSTPTPTTTPTDQEKNYWKNAKIFVEKIEVNEECLYQQTHLSIVIILTKLFFNNKKT